MKVINSKDMFLLEELVKRNFSSKYKDSVIGIFWSVLRPLLMMIVFTIVFSTIFGRAIPNFPVYFLCGRCVFDFFTGAVSSSMVAIKGNKNIILRTSAPRYIFIIACVFTEFFNFIISFILLIVIIIVTNAPLNLFMAILSFIPIFSLTIMCVGLGLILAIACVYYTDIQHLWSVITTLLMYASAVFYPMNIVPEPFRSYFVLNPLYWIINQFRCFMYHDIVPQTIYLFNSLLLSTIILVLGIIVFKKYQNKVTMKF